MSSQVLLENSFLKIVFDVKKAEKELYLFFVLIFVFRLRDAWHVPGLMRLLSRQSISLCVTLLFLTCVYYAGFWLGETSSSYKDNDWKASMVTNEGFLEVSKILADPKTTNDPMVGWIVNKQQVQL